MHSEANYKTMNITFQDFQTIWDNKTVKADVDQSKLERCVLTVKRQGHSKEAAFKICNSSLSGSANDTEKKEGEEFKDSVFSDLQEIGKGSRRTTEEGYLVVDAILARTGIQTYLAAQMGTPPGFEPTDIIRVYRPPAEVFKDESLRTFDLKPVTNNHPNASSDVMLLDTDTIKQFQIGTIGQDVRKDGDLMRATLIITDPRAINDIENGKVQISNGYRADTVMGSGVTEAGEEYDAMQINIRGNHAALVDLGRCGEECSITDSLEITDCPGCGGSCSTKNDKIGDKPMSLVKRKIGTFDCEIAESSVVVVDAALATLDEKMANKDNTIADLKTQLDAAKKEVETVKGERDSLKTQLADAESKIPNGTQLDAMIADHANFIQQVKNADATIVTDGKDKGTIMKEVVSKFFPQENFADASEEYLKARFDGLLASQASAGHNLLDNAFNKMVPGGNQQNPAPTFTDAESVRQQVIQRNNTKANGWGDRS